MPEACVVHRILEAPHDRARQGMQARDAQALGESAEALQRTLNMFKGVVAKTRVG